MKLQNFWAIGKGGSRAPTLGRGFTLLEILVVLFIVGIALSLITVNFGRDRGAQLEDEARLLALLLESARDEGIASGRSLAWRANEDGYAFLRRERGLGWVALGGDEHFKARAWPSQIALAQLRINGIEVTPGEALVFTPSGLNLPFQLVLASENWQVVLDGDFAGAIRLIRTRRDELPPG